jgi:hypothetical protein
LLLLLFQRQKQVQEEFEGIRDKGANYLKEIQEYYVFPIFYAHFIDKKNFHKFILQTKVAPNVNCVYTYVS